MSKHLELGGDIGFMGQPVGAEIEIGHGRSRSYQGGDIYWSQDTGARAVFTGNVGCLLQIARHLRDPQTFAEEIARG